jgi:hypothetical protein
LSSRASVENALSTTTGAPERKERRLAIAGRRRDEDDRRVGRRYQALEQRRPIDDAWSQRRGRLAGHDAPPLGGLAERRRASGATWLRLTSRHASRRLIDHFDLSNASHPGMRTDREV